MEHTEIYASLQDAVRAVVKARNLSRVQLADLVCNEFPESALSPENLGHLLSDRAATVVNILGLVAVLARLDQDEPLAAMARHAGFALVPVKEACSLSILSASAGYARDVAETAQEIATAIEEGMTEERLASIERELREDELRRQALGEAARHAHRQYMAEAQKHEPTTSRPQKNRPA
jgi:hypothetical protein